MKERDADIYVVNPEGLVLDGVVGMIALGVARLEPSIEIIKQPEGLAFRIHSEFGDQMFDVKVTQRLEV